MAEFAEIVARRGLGTMQETAGVRIIEVADDHLIAEMPFRPALQQLTGLFHTGALLTLADGTATMLCMHAVDPTGEATGGNFPLAIQLSANMIRNGNKGPVRAEARFAHRGRTTMVVETSVRDPEGRLMVLVTTTHIVLSGTTG